MNQKNQETELFTSRIYEQLLEASDDGITIEYIDENFSSVQSGSQMARDLGRKRNADIVIWGYYLSELEVVAYLEVLNPIEELDFTHQQ